MRTTFKQFTTLALALGAIGFHSSFVEADDDSLNVHEGRSRVYENLDPVSLEDVSTATEIKAVTMGNIAPMQIWKVLEHGERVECLDCIPRVKELLWENDSRTREISAWWLRRRIFGVFGPGEVYEQVLTTLHESDDDRLRAYAAEAVGEFLVASGVPHVAQAAIEDDSPTVRLSAVHALTRLNHEGPNGELAIALGDSDTSVRLAALHGALRVHVFSGIDAVVALIDDPSADVRRKAARTLGSMGASDAVMGLVLLTSPETESDPSVRAAAVTALGRIADVSARASVSAAEEDPDQFVRDAARIALRQL